MLPGFDNLRMESFMPIHEGFKSMQDDQESFTADEIDKIHSEEDNFADIQTIKPTDAQIKSKSMAKDNGNKAKEPVTVNTEEDDTKEFITKYIESEEVEEPETTKAKASKVKSTVAKENTEKEGFQGSMITQMGTNKLILVTLLITMVSFVLNKYKTREAISKLLSLGSMDKTIIVVNIILALLVFVILRIFC